MAILIDPPIDWPGNAQRPQGYPKCSHMFSDIPGEAGSTELMAFALRIGMRREWLQKAGTHHEHFDVFGPRRARAVAAGAREVTRREAVTVWRTKSSNQELHREQPTCRASATAAYHPIDNRQTDGVDARRKR